MANGDPARAIDHIQKLSRSSACLDPGQTRELAIACEAGKEVLARGADRLVRAAMGSPMLSSKSCDSTPICVAHRLSRTLPSGKKLRSSGRSAQDFLVKNQFLRYWSHTDGWCTRVLFSEPSPLQHGKSVNAILQASLRDWKSLRQLGHAGCAVEHYVWDRMGIGSLERTMRQWHRHQQVLGHGALAQSTLPAILNLTEFVVVTGCAMHDSHNAFRWAFRADVENRQFMRDIYVGMASLRNAHDVLAQHLADWVALRLSYGDRLGVDWVDGQRCLWYGLGVEAETVDEMTSALQLRWEGGRLWVSRDLSTSPDVVGRVTACLTSIWRFRKWTESRWLTVGVGSRSAVAGFLLGLPDLVEHVQQTTSGKDFYLKGFWMMNGHHERTFSCRQRW